MSTTPGDHTWADAGLVPPDNSSAVPTSERTTVPVEASDQPRAPQPVLRDEAAEAAEGDVLEQEQDAAGSGTAARSEVPDDAPEHDVLEQSQDVSGTGYAPGSAGPGQRDDAAEHDVLEQAREVPDDDDAYPSV